MAKVRMAVKMTMKTKMMRLTMVVVDVLDLDESSTKQAAGMKMKTMMLIVTQAKMIMTMLKMKAMEM